MRWTHEALRALAADACHERDGQATVEYALVLVAFASMVAAMGVIWHFGRDGELIRLAMRWASHSLGEGLSAGVLQDVCLY